MVIGSKPDGNALGNLFFATGSSEAQPEPEAFRLASPLIVTPHEFLLGLFPHSYQVCCIFAWRVEPLND
jgi:hypothetical protein